MTQNLAHNAQPPQCEAVEHVDVTDWCRKRCAEGASFLVVRAGQEGKQLAILIEEEIAPLDLRLERSPKDIDATDAP